MNQFTQDLFNLIEKHKKDVDSKNCARIIIKLGIAVSLVHAPNKLKGMKDVLSFVNEGIDDYEKSQS